MTWLARSANPEKGLAEQTYARHIQGVKAYVQSYLNEAEPFLDKKRMTFLSEMVSSASSFHDLGKLDDSNQQVLQGKARSRTLPHIHPDAGSAFSIKINPAAAVLIYSHHTLLPDFAHESNRGKDCFRIDEEIAHTTQILPELVKRHEEALGPITKSQSLEEPPSDGIQMTMRMGLSMLVDADFSDSSARDLPLAEIGRNNVPCLRPEERLKALDRFVAGFSVSDDRSKLRQEIYHACRNQHFAENIISCDSPVGTGKTTAVMAHLLTAASEKKLRRIFVILPFTSIIHQSVDVYRKALVLPGEKPEDVVAEIHHLADFENESSREFAACWHAPVIVTTAVAFFETLAAAHAAGLRRLHQLIGAGIFVDEVHAALPVNLLPPAWLWIKTLASDWSCFWILASGSLNRFWQIKEIDDETPEIPELVPDGIRKKAFVGERDRLDYEYLADPFTVESISDFIAGTPGPRLVILNTVQNAAVIALTMKNSGKFSQVFHLSTALTPDDREKNLNRVREYMNIHPNGNWVLVGTSCIEAGINFDFATGFRENASLVSLLQAAGRVNRNGARQNSVMYPFRLAEDCRLSVNKGLQDSVYVLEKTILEKGKTISPDLCTQAMIDELKLKPEKDALFLKILDAEQHCSFPEVEELFTVIDTDSRLVVVDTDIVSRIENFEPVSWRDIQQKSVQIRGYKLDQLQIPSIDGHPDICKWSLLYDDFIGYMAGILANEDLFSTQGGVL